MRNIKKGFAKRAQDSIDEPGVRFCKTCGAPVTPVEGKILVGGKDAIYPQYQHARSKNPTPCNKSPLMEEDVTTEDWWNA